MWFVIELFFYSSRLVNVIMVNGVFAQMSFISFFFRSLNEMDNNIYGKQREEKNRSHRKIKV